MPGQPQNEGIIERTHQDVEIGVAACLLQARLPSQLWTFAAPCYCHLGMARLDGRGRLAKSSQANGSPSVAVSPFFPRPRSVWTAGSGVP